MNAFTSLTPLSLNWHDMFVPAVPLEVILRGSVVYLTLIFLTRIVLKREAGTVGLPDLLMVVLIADAAQNAMSADYHSITDGLILVGTIVFWNFALDWLAYYFPLVRRFLRPPPLPLVKNGRILWRNMRREYITEEELVTAARRAGIQNLAHVREARMEGDGQISIIPNESRGTGQDDQRRAQ